MILVNIVISIAIMIGLQLLGMVIFNWMTPYNDMEELKRGNKAAALAMGGKFIGTSIILGVAAYTNTSILFMIIWFVVGYLCLIAVYWIFEWVTPSIKVSDALKEGNVAIGILLCMVFIGMAFAVSSLII